MTRKALGRGLNALLRTVETTTTGLAEVAVDQIEPNPFQPRRTFSADKLKELADSIRASGVVQPVLLRHADGRYQLIAGERRWRAAREAGLTAIPAVVRDIGDRDALEMALTENLLREDLNPLEAAEGYSALQQKHGLSHEEIAEPVQATQNNAFALGESVVNNIASSFMVGFNTTPTLTVTGSNVGIGTMGGVNVGIGTMSTQAELVVTNGNVGIGTWTANSALQVVGNVGIGTTAPNGALDVGTGTICLNHVCDASWPATGSNYWTLQTSGNIGISTIQNVGIGTSFVGGTNEGALSVMNGNVGIGTWVVGSALNVVGNVGIGTKAPGGALDVGTGSICINHVCDSSWPSAGSNYWTLQTSGNIGISTIQNVGIGTSFVGGTNEGALSVMNGNVGIGTWVVNGGALIVASGAGNIGIGTTAPGGALDVGTGSICINHVCDSSWSAAGSNYWTLQTSGNIGISTIQNVGIGTSFVGGTGEAALSVMNGNVGIGTWAPVANFQVSNTASGSFFVVDSSGNVGIGTVKTSTGAMSIMGGNVGIGTWVPGGMLQISNGPSPFIVDSSGNVGIGTTITSNAYLSVFGGNVGIGTWVPGVLLDVKGIERMNAELYSNNAVTVASQAATVPVTYKLTTITNNAASSVTITITTAGAVDGQPLIVRFYDFSAVAQTLTWVNTENSETSVPTTSNGSTTLPLTAGFMYNSQTSKWRCIAVS